jgi:hypothetical protein
VSTFALAALSGATYYLWWNKPLDVRYSVQVNLLPLPQSISAQGPQSAIVEEICNPQQTPAVIPNPEPNPEPSPVEPNSTSVPAPKSTRMQRLSAFIGRERPQQATFLTNCHEAVRDVFCTFFGEPDIIMEPNSPLRAPTFYAPETPDDILFFGYVSIVAALAFGAIQCAAWSFHFLSVQEKLAWRVSVGFVCGLPAFAGFIALTDRVVKIPARFAQVIIFPSIVIYILARIVLLLLPCLALRELPPKAFVDIQWSSFLPHIS